MIEPDKSTTLVAEGNPEPETMEAVRSRLVLAQRRIEVETALERVRTRTMAMQRSDELAEAASVAFQQLRALGVASEHGRFMFAGIEENADTTLWLTEPGGHVISRSYTVPLLGFGPFAAVFRVWKNTARHERKERVIVSEYAGEIYLGLLTYLSKYSSFSDEEALHRLLKEPAFTPNWIFHIACFAHGALVLTGDDHLDTEALEILKRFAHVFEQTYTRFLDLKQAEERAREAERQAALDRIRAEIASMRTAKDLERITPLVWFELTKMRVPFTRCGILIVDEKNETVQIFLTSPKGKALGAFVLGFNEESSIRAGIDAWRDGTVYTEIWDAARMQEWVEFLQARGLIKAYAHYLDAESPPERLVLHFVPFAQGMLYVGNSSPLDSVTVEAVQALADTFAVAFARYDDFKRLEAKNNEVETTLAELKATQQRLIHSEKMASLGVLTAGIAHQIKNPLNFVNNLAEISDELVCELREALATGEDIEPLITDISNNLKVIAQHGKRADNIVRAMIQHASASSGRREPTDINTLLEECIDLINHSKQELQRGLSCKFARDFERDLEKVSVVPREIGRVFLNLLDNALNAVHKHARSAGPSYNATVTVSTRKRPGEVEIRIIDNGSGVPEKIKDRIFEPFFTTRPPGSGTGLGLSLAYDIITHGHGGVLSLERAGGEGATFIITLPRT